MIRRDYLFNTLLSLFIGLTCFTLSYVGETRLDAYTSVFALDYVVLKVLFRPRRLGRDWLLVALLAIFSLSVAFRILEVIG
ncbi:MAG: hypothetical protein JHC28_04290 [Thermoprotei archaeon]|uniref:Uncharacterized protein n=1 Tax=Fervidicoccus fontis TaxID=683846 RepID=A0A7J3SKL8_9CREN|nr:hypothetical protein [Thermoprotei archaeon]